MKLKYKLKYTPIIIKSKSKVSSSQFSTLHVLVNDLISILFCFEAVSLRNTQKILYFNHYQIYIFSYVTTTTYIIETSLTHSAYYHSCIQLFENFIIYINLLFNHLDIADSPTKHA